MRKKIDAAVGYVAQVVEFCIIIGEADNTTKQPFVWGVNRRHLKVLGVDGRAGYFSVLSDSYSAMRTLWQATTVLSI